MPIDNSEVAAVGSRLQSVGGRIGAPASAALRKTAYDIEADAKMLIEAYDAYDTGNMFNSVSTSISGDGRTGAIRAEIGPTAEYSIFVHEGTSVMPARPFMGDAFDRRMPGYTSALATIAAREAL